MKKPEDKKKPQTIETYDSEGKLVNKQYIYFSKSFIHDSLSGYDTAFTTYVYNKDNTLNYAIKRKSSDGKEFIGNKSKYFYQFDSIFQTAIVWSFNSELCSDFPLKLMKVYNTKGQLLEERFWEVEGGGVIDTVCTKAFGRIKKYNLFDTSWYNKIQELKYKITHSYNNEDELTRVWFYGYSNGRLRLGETRPYCKPMNWKYCYPLEKYYQSNPRNYYPQCPSDKFIYECDEEERELTIIPYLKALGKMK